MRLTIIPLVNPTEQQYLDLHKIWPDQSPFELAKMCKAGEQFYAARFNDRLLGAAKILWIIALPLCGILCARVTRRRGVGSYLLEEICQTIPDITLWKFDISEVALQERSNAALLVGKWLQCHRTT
ncbi:aspartate 1-decarboxylase autocleavage activator PanM [Providencia rettgeri]|nr:aspartate 1-decarboxylase autocleavage activator PanM [Providencia rettgeri]